MIPAYEKNPQEIYRRSFAMIEREADLDGFPEAMRSIATRLIHACGMIDLIDDLAFSPGAAEAGREALRGGCAIHCDTEMTRVGVIESRLPEGSRLVCFLNHREVVALGCAGDLTRSAAAVGLWDELEGSICLIGNAPTALFRLLERLDEGAARPSLIVGMPVGFVGAEESKAELIANPRGCEFIALRGRRGGSALASATCNALVAGLNP